MAGSAKARFALPLALALALGLGAGAAHAERAWVKDELFINVRTGAGREYRILGVLSTGDSVEILERRKDWIQVKASDQIEGWIPEGYLQPEMPARLRLARYEAETAAMRERFAGLSQELDELRAAKAALESSQSEWQARIDELTQENLELRVGSRAPEWLAGAFILLVGALLGIAVHRSARRRPSSRIRL